MDSVFAAIIGVMGSIVGGVIASRLTNKTTVQVTQRNIEEQRNVMKERKQTDEGKEQKLIKIKAMMVYNDLLNACYEGFMFLKGNLKSSIVAPNLISINKNYSEDVAFICALFTSEEIILIYNLYGMIEKIRRDILSSNYSKSIFSDVEADYEMMVQIVFKDKYSNISSLNAENITKDFLLDSMNKDYKIIFNKLNEAKAY